MFFAKTRTLNLSNALSQVSIRQLLIVLAQLGENLQNPQILRKTIHPLTAFFRVQNGDNQGIGIKHNF